MPGAKTAFHPLTPERWADLEALFGARGACDGCWCMFWRLKRADYAAQRGEGNQRAFEALVRSGAEPGLLAYREGKPVGWVAIAPRAAYEGLNRSRPLGPVDEKPVWSATCFFVERAHRGSGLMGELLQAAIRFAASKGATLIEGYPVVKTGKVSPGDAYTGFARTFEEAGFTEVARRTPRRAIVRKAIRPKKK